MKPTRWELHREDRLGFKENLHPRRMESKVMFETPVLYIYIYEVRPSHLVPDSG